eukprot:4432713-Pyramimonas_sp.AAC.1
MRKLRPLAVVILSCCSGCLRANLSRAPGLARAGGRARPQSRRMTSATDEGRGEGDLEPEPAPTDDALM